MMMSQKELEAHDARIARRLAALPPEPVEPLVDFCKRHGDFPLKSPSRWLFQDGASVAYSEFGPPQQIEPPDGRQRIFARREYALGKLGRAQADFRQLKNALQGAGAAFKWDKDEYGDPPPDTDRYTGQPDGVAALRRLQSIVLKHRTALEAIDGEIANLPESKEAQRRQELNEIMAQAAANQQAARAAEIAAIEI
jgi:hypothetical protein